MADARPCPRLGVLERGKRLEREGGWSGPGGAGARCVLSVLGFQGPDWMETLMVTGALLVGVTFHWRLL
jgi:hypothetical protein